MALLQTLGFLEPSQATARNSTGTEKPMMEVFWQNLRYGVRILAKSPGFALMAVLTLTIGIGANTAIFTVVSSVLLRPLPYNEPDRLMILSERDSRFEDASVAYLNFKDWQAQNGSFQQMSLW